MAERKYAAGTTVAATKTESEIKDLLGKRGVTKIATMVDGESYTLMFEHAGIAYRMALPLPDPESPSITTYRQGSSTFRRADNAIREHYEKEVNRRWRAFGAVIKAKLIAVEEGISTMEREFIGDAITGSGMTVAEEFVPKLQALAGTGKLPMLELPSGRGK